MASIHDKDDSAKEQRPITSPAESSIDLAQRILQYLRAKPQAKDTLEGIAEWWLLQNRIEDAVGQVSSAVEWLVTKGYLLNEEAPGSRTLYAINPAKGAEADEFPN